MQAGLTWLCDIKKTSGRSNNPVCQEKENWLTHLFRAMGVPEDVRVSGVRCQERETEKLKPEH
jgi:hypothetical protein